MSGRVLQRQPASHERTFGTGAGLARGGADGLFQSSVDSSCMSRAVILARRAPEWLGGGGGGQVAVLYLQSSKVAGSLQMMDGVATISQSLSSMVACISPA